MIRLGMKAHRTRYSSDNSGSPSRQGQDVHAGQMVDEIRQRRHRTGEDRQGGGQQQRREHQHPRLAAGDGLNRNSPEQGGVGHHVVEVTVMEKGPAENGPAPSGLIWRCRMLTIIAVTCWHQIRKFTWRASVATGG